MSHTFRQYIQAVGSGPHTSKNLDREEAAHAMKLMLTEEATPDQIGAFLIAHRIKRPTGEELAGFLDTWDELAQKIPAIDRPVTVLGCPYDGRSRTAPVTVLTALGLAAAGVANLTHGSDRMPTKYGIPTIDIWRGIGVDWTKISRDRLCKIFTKTGLSFYYQPNFFSAAETIIPYRDRLGKRPPVATMELMWNPYAGDNVHLVCGYVHPPTEGLFQNTLRLRGDRCITSVKGLEGSCDLSRSRTAIISTWGEPGSTNESPQWQRLLLNPFDYDLGGSDIPLESEMQYLADLNETILGKDSELLRSAIWNLGFYLWRCGVCDTLENGLATAESCFKSGEAADKLSELQSEFD